MECINKGQKWREGKKQCRMEKRDRKKGKKEGKM